MKLQKQLSKISYLGFVLLATLLFMANRKAQTAHPIEYQKLVYVPNYSPGVGMIHIYKVNGEVAAIKFKSKDRNTALLKELNQLGAEGWEMETSNSIPSPNHQGVEYIFKRERP